MRLHLILLAFAALVAWPQAAHAQTFPADAAFKPLRCAHHAMIDGRRDEAAAVDERDLVGDLDHAAGLRAADADFLYLRLRLDADALPGGVITGFSWGFAIDTDNEPTHYEILAIVDGVTNSVLLYKNTQTTTADDATDPADTPPVAMYDVATHAKSTAADTSTGGNGDFYLTFALPWSDLQPLGLRPTTKVHVYAASSTVANALNGDFACHSGGGAPHFSELDGDVTVIDPVVDSDGDGFSDATEVEAGSDPNDPNSQPGAGVEPSLAGGGGCHVGAGAPGGGGLALLALAACGLGLHRRRRR